MSNWVGACAARGSYGWTPLLCVTLLACACSGADPEAARPSSVSEWMRPVARLGPPPGVPEAPFEVLLRDRRGVLFSYPVVDLAIEELAWDREQGVARVRAVLPRAASRSARVQVKPRVLHGDRLETLPPQVADVVYDEAGGGVVTVALSSPALEGSPEKRLRLRARAIPDDWVIVHETDEIEISPRATLEFAFGFLPQHQASVALTEPTRFAVSLCQRGSCEKVFEETAQPAPGTGWRDRAVSLAAHSGQRASFLFEAARVPPLPEDDPAPSVAFPLWSVPTLYSAVERDISKTNLLLISLDTLRADHLGTYGYARDTSPFIDGEIARRGTVFEQAFSTATTTAASHMSMFTGLPPTVHGVYGSTFFRGLASGIPTLAEALHARQFETGAVTENGAIGAYRGFTRGFSTYYENKLRERRGGSGVIEDTLAQSLAWLDRHRGKRFFLFVHTYQVHSPYRPPEDFRAFFERDDLDPPRTRSLPETWRPVSYDREIRYTDAQLASFFAELDARGLLENTIVILLSDHGEAFDEHGSLGHGPAMYDEVLRVPLIVRGPGIAQSRRVEAPVSFVDLMATLLDWVGLPDGDWPGASFAGHARAGARETRSDATGETMSTLRPLFSESRAATEFYIAGKGQLRTRRLPVPNYAIRLGDRKLIRTHAGAAEASGGAQESAAPSYQYFDLAADPREQRNLWNAADPDAELMRQMLERHIEASEALRGSYQETVRTETGVPGVLDLDRRKKLEALGYIE
jgi:arylsulfatase A-like enzyme